jgi:lipopolysaccharide/colanic/teichoic acid biosynthesis glycosyltransferase
MMLSLRSLDRFTRLLAQRRAPAPDQPMLAHFRAVLDRERKRADRLGSHFSLLTFRLSDPAERQEGFPALFDVLQRRLRTTDEIGWLNQDQVGVMLPETGPAWAWAVAAEVLRAYPDELPVPHCEVYGYPSGPVSPRPPRERARTGWRTRSPRRFAVIERDADVPVRRLEDVVARPLPFWKRSLDVFGASVGIGLAAPVMLLAAAAIALSDRGPVFFRQWRRGLGGRKFQIYKFRTMRVGAEREKAALQTRNELDGPAFKLTEDPRVTPVGRFLRCTSLDELPQLWNVLKGDMSLVGPRPLPCEEADACEPWQKRRLDVTPGVTGEWQVQGRASVPFVEWIRMDLRYIASRSLLHDLRLLARTIPAVVSRRGAH